MTTEVLIRAATADDVEWLASRLRLYFSDCYGTKRPLFQNDEFTQGFMLTLMKEHLVLIAEKGKERVGFVAGVLSPALYEPSLRVLSETFWWVEKAYRRSKAATLLLDAFTAWGRRHADWIFFGLPTDADVTDRTMARKGYRMQERFYLLEVT